MTCSSCVHRIESNMMEKTGVLSASVSLTTSRGTFTFDPAIIGPRDVIKTVEVCQIFCLFLFVFVHIFYIFFIYFLKQDMGYGCSLATTENRYSGLDHKEEIKK